MNTKDFHSASDLVAYVNDQGIVKAKVVSVRVLDHRWWLFWYP